MRVVSLVIVLSLAACGGVHSYGWFGDQSASLPTTGTDASRDGFYDGGVFDPDLSRGHMPMSE